MNVVQIQEEMREVTQYTPEVEHLFSDGCYARKLHMPKGFAGVGALHKTSHHFVVSKGKLMLRTGDKKIIVEAGYHGVTKPGDKRLIIALEDSIMTTFHVTNLTNVDKIGKMILGEEL
tara:strand:- start:261 stop:614 length:354 start_codon:yes stop_codon:yes gene_type:complete